MNTPATSSPGPIAFALADGRLHWAHTNGPVLLQGALTPTQLAALPSGLLVSVNACATPADLHEGQWEMHPEGEEIILLTAGAVDLGVDSHGQTDWTPLPAGSGAIIPAGVWHRFRLRQPGQLIALTTHQGTQLRAAVD